MRIKFNPDIAYVTGFWKPRRVREGVGIAGDDEAQQIFAEEAMRTLAIPPEKLQVKGEKIFFYHSAYRKYMEKLVDDELDVFKWRNEFSAKFIAGIFDACGGVDEQKGAVYLARATDADQMLLERLGLKTRRIGARLFIAVKSIPLFAGMVLPRMRRRELKSRLSALMRSGNERDPR